MVWKSNILIILSLLVNANCCVGLLQRYGASYGPPDRRLWSILPSSLEKEIALKEKKLETVRQMNKRYTGKVIRKHIGIRRVEE